MAGFRPAARRCHRSAHRLRRLGDARRSPSMRPTGPASTICSPTSSLSGSSARRRRTERLPPAAPRTEPCGARRDRGARRPSGRQPRPPGCAGHGVPPRAASPSSRAPWPRVEVGPVAASWRTAAGSAPSRSPGGRRRHHGHRRPHEAGLPALRPVKGHILRLGPADPSAGHVPRCCRRTVRGLVRGRSVYLVPRHDGSIVVGATVEERGHDIAVRAGAVHDLLCDARPSSRASTRWSSRGRRRDSGRPRRTTCRGSDGPGSTASLAAVGSLSQRHPPGPADRRGRRRPGGETLSASTR